MEESMKTKKLAVVGVLVAALAINGALVACDDTSKGGDDPKPVNEYTVTFDANGGSLSGNATVKIESGKKITGAPTATKAEHTFEAWYDEADGGVKIDLTKYTVSKDVTLYAHYTPGSGPVVGGVTITFDANGGKFEGDKTTIELETDEDGLILDAEDPTRADYRFTGWYTAAEGGEAVDPMFDELTEAQTLYAHWARSFTITFDAGDGTLTGSSTVKVDENAKIPANQIPTATKAGNDFYGWYESANAETALDLTTYTVTKDATLIAKYGEYTMPLKTLKNTAGDTAIGYRIEAEEAKTLGETNSDNSAHPGEFLEDVEGASGGHSIGYFGKTGNSMTYTFKSATTGTANLTLMASSAKIFMDFSAGFTMYPEDQTVTPTMLKIELNGQTVTFSDATLRGSFENFVFNKYWDPIALGELNIVEGTNTLVITALKDEGPNFDYLDIVTDLTLTSVDGSAASGEALQAPPPAPVIAYESAVTGKLIVVDHADGPAVQKAVLTFTDDITADTLTTNPFTVGGMGVAATDKVYLSDANGDALAEGTTTSKNVTIEYAYAYSGWGPAGNVKPFDYSQQTGRNTWKPISSYTLDIKGLTIGETTYTKYTGTFTAEYVIPELEKWDTTGSYTDGDITLKYASFTPEAVAGKEGNKPLVIWLHGAGEGGADPTITLLGNQVVNLGKQSIQKYFQTETVAGAYVLAPQAPTMWMDSGNGQQGGSNVGESIYTESLFNLIQQFVTDHTDIDTNRIYIGGCSNGGWMTIEMLSKHGEYFAAAYPIAVPFDKAAGLTEDEFAKLVNVPMWITHSKDDTTVKIGTYSEPANWWEQATFQSYAELNSNQLYIELLKAGATNVHYSLFANVSIAAGDEDAATYQGHYSWIYVLRDECSKVQTTTGSGEDGAFVLADIDETATNTVTVGGDEVTLWGWLAAQAKA